MKTLKITGFGLICLVFVVVALAANGDSSLHEEQTSKPSKLGVLWTSGDREVALKMAFMYTYNAKKFGWWDEIQFIVWGASTKLLAADQELQAEIKKMKEIGIELLACKACADQYCVSQKLEELGVTVKYMGKPLTDMLKSDWVVLTF